jgi:threonyl-tRNA synthetase
VICRTPDAAITIYHCGVPGEPEHWWDLCAGPHVASTGAINPEAIELERLAGAYWRGDENRAMLTRIYGTAWEEPVQLAAYHHVQVWHCAKLRAWHAVEGEVASMARCRTVQYACVLQLTGIIRVCDEYSKICTAMLTRIYSTAWEEPVQLAAYHHVQVRVLC